MITDEMVEKAAAAYDYYTTDECISGALRAALEAVAPMLTEQVIEILRAYYLTTTWPEKYTEAQLHKAAMDAKAILARAQELDRNA